MDALIRCPQCQNVLGKRYGEHIIVKHQGREVIAKEIVSIRCNQCHATWLPEPERRPAA